ncbi:hypothetical protein [Streptomyces sp. KL116D]|uniref:hypothetical protein n=1 Tax=Streptomyces sp. KL116D TaxID=3045152 RepID=UPI003555BED1
MSTPARSPSTYTTAMSPQPGRPQRDYACRGPGTVTAYRTRPRSHVQRLERRRRRRLRLGAAQRRQDPVERRERRQLGLHRRPEQPRAPANVRHRLRA